MHDQLLPPPASSLLGTFPSASVQLRQTLSLPWELLQSLARVAETYSISELRGNRELIDYSPLRDLGISSYNRSQKWTPWMARA